MKEAIKDWYMVIKGLLFLFFIVIPVDYLGIKKCKKIREFEGGLPVYLPTRESELLFEEMEEKRIQEENE